MKESSINLIDEEYGAVLKAKGVWAEECPVSLARLRKLEVPYWSFNDETQWGQLIVMDACAPYVVKIFEELHRMRFPIYSMKTIDEFDGSDEASMEANNSSAFNYRRIPGTDRISIHSYGLAIDVNTVQNPYFGHSYESDDKACTIVEIWPKQGVEYVNRSLQRKGMVEPIVEVFYQAGFRDWGGTWKAFDYHHFQLPRPLAYLMASMTAEHAEVFFKWYVDHPEDPVRKGEEEKDFLQAYGDDPNDFMQNYSQS